MDATGLQQILMNLSINSKDAMSNGGIITFSASNYVAGYSSLIEDKNLLPGNYICFQVSDTGQGIEEDKLKHIFDPFYTTKGPGKGTGLGLSMVYGIVKNAGGKIEVRSIPNIGTTFTLYLPSAEKGTEKDATEFVMKPIGNGQSILVIDDEKMIREMARDMLNILGFKVLLAASGVEGIELYSKYRSEISLVILDLLMPEMNGKVCFERLKIMNSKVKVIVASGMGESDKKKELEDMGIVAYLEKPYRLEHMTEKIREALN
jgi:CheY-like chemotaxis protein